MKCVNTGDKVKELRTALGLTQEAIANDKVSKSLISMIERGRRGLTLETAKIIADSLNVYYSNLGKDITAEFLMETEEDQIRSEIKEKIDYLQKTIAAGNIDERLIIETFERTIAMTQEWGVLDYKAELAILRGKFYYDSFQYNLALKDFFDAHNYFVHAMDYNQIARMDVWIGNTYYIQMMIDPAQFHYAKAKDTAIRMNISDKDLIMSEVISNQILCFRAVKDYASALETITVFKNLHLNASSYKREYDKLALMEANTYRDIRHYEMAIKLYDKLKQEEKQLDLDILYLLYVNYANLYRQQKKLKKAFLALEKASKIIEKVGDNYYLPRLCIEEARCYNVQGDYNKVVTLLRDGLKVAEMVDRKDAIVDIHFAFAEIYLKLEDYVNAKTHVVAAEHIITERKIKSKEPTVNSLYSQIYLGLGEPKKVIEYLQKIGGTIL